MRLGDAAGASWLVEKVLSLVCCLLRGVSSHETFTVRYSLQSSHAQVPCQQCVLCKVVSGGVCLFVYFARLW